MKLFHLPDLGEGLQEAEIAEWRVAVGDHVVADQPLVAVETAKAIVDIPSPQAGRVAALFGKPGEVLHVGDPLVEFEEAGVAADSGTVVGEVKAGREVREEAPAIAHPVAGARATPAVRALAHRLGVDLALVPGSGPDGLVSAADVQRAARLLAELGPEEPLRGVRRAMARNMAKAGAEVVPVTLTDDADIHAWAAGADITVRLIRALVKGCAAEPALNAWYDGNTLARRVFAKVDVGIAMDTEDGLFVPVLRDVAGKDGSELRRLLDVAKAAVKARTILPEELRSPTVTLTNFGTLAGRHGTPVVLPPTVAILGAGSIRPQVVAVAGKPAVHRILPLSLTFDHRAVTGGEASRFLAAVIGDLQLAE
jgi:pyruvate dehydrogenase E2 component (dihydrolipoamide acetyltransferase)